MIGDLRVCFVGDSFVAGVGDPEHRGWVGRLVAGTGHTGDALTAYNLGVRGHTSRDVRQRWRAECQQRLPESADCRVVVSFGVNDAICEAGAPRVAADESAANLDAVLEGVAGFGWDRLVVGPPPVADEAHNERTAALDDVFRAVCRDAAVSYVSVLEQLTSNDTWMREVEQGDGAHPGADGYTRLAELIRPAWEDWITREGPGGSGRAR